VQTLQICRVPDDLKERLRERARQADVTMGDYVVELIRRDLDQPTVDEWLARLEELPPHDDLPFTAADLVAEGRAERDDSWGS
jgi:hypothetical protein